MANRENIANTAIDTAEYISNPANLTNGLSGAIQKVFETNISNRPFTNPLNFFSVKDMPTGGLIENIVPLDDNGTDGFDGTGDNPALTFNDIFAPVIQPTVSYLNSFTSAFKSKKFTFYATRLQQGFRSKAEVAEWEKMLENEKFAEYESFVTNHVCKVLGDFASQNPLATASREFPWTPEQTTTGVSYDTETDCTNALVALGATAQNMMFKSQKYSRIPGKSVAYMGGDDMYFILEITDYQKLLKLGLATIKGFFPEYVKTVINTNAKVGDTTTYGNNGTTTMHIVVVPDGFGKTFAGYAPNTFKGMMVSRKVLTQYIQEPIAMYNTLLVDGGGDGINRLQNYVLSELSVFATNYDFPCALFTA